MPKLGMIFKVYKSIINVGTNESLFDFNLNICLD